jgi:hypothetical protein
LNLPYWLAEAVRIIDQHRLSKRHESRKADERRKRQQDISRKAGIPI